MLRVKDENGNLIPGLLKDGLGNIIVKNDAEYNRFKLERQQQEAINNLTQEISELKLIINKLLSEKN